MVSDGGRSRCRYAFVPEGAAEESRMADVLDDEGTWRCHRTAEDGAEHCLFHRPPAETDDERVAKAFVETVEASTDGTPRENRFVGARFDSFPLAYEAFESADNYPLDLRYAEFAGEVDLEYATLSQPLFLSGATFSGPVSAWEATFEDDVRLDGATFEASVAIDEATFANEVTFAGATFREGGDFSGTTFGGSADFSAVAFEDRASFVAATFDGVASFDDATLTTGDFTDAAFRARGSFEGVRPPDGHDPCRLDFHGSRLDAGTLGHEGDVVYDLSEATVGDVTLGWSDEENPFRAFCFWKTAFDGFSFDRYRDWLAANDWTIHSPGLDPFDNKPTDPGKRIMALESTYRKAKDGAGRVGDKRAASEFFRKEMRCRRRYHAHELSSADCPRRGRLKAGLDWVANLVLGATSGYGERPMRVVATAVGTMAVFTAAFVLRLGPAAFDSPLGFVLLGMESFVTLVLGGSPPVHDMVVQVLAQVEAFLGSFLIALFVFTLTRSLHR